MAGVEATPPSPPRAPPPPPGSPPPPPEAPPPPLPAQPLTPDALALVDASEEAVSAQKRDSLGQGQGKRPSVLLPDDDEGAGSSGPGRPTLHRISMLEKYKGPEKPTMRPPGFMPDPLCVDHVGEVELQILRIQEAKEVNAAHLKMELLSEGIIGQRVETHRVLEKLRDAKQQQAQATDVDEPEDPKKAKQEHCKRTLRDMEYQVTAKKRNLEAANRWIAETKPKSWLLFHEKATWIQNKVLEQEKKHDRMKMLNRLGKKGTSFQNYLEKHRCDYDVAGRARARRREQPAEEEPAPDPSAERRRTITSKPSAVNASKFWRGDLKGVDAFDTL